MELLWGWNGFRCGRGEEGGGWAGVEAAGQEGRVDGGERWKADWVSWSWNCGVWEGGRRAGGGGGGGHLVEQGGDGGEVGVGGVGWEGGWREGEPWQSSANLSLPSWPVPEWCIVRVTVFGDPSFFLELTYSLDGQEGVEPESVWPRQWKVASQAPSAFSTEILTKQLLLGTEDRNLSRSPSCFEISELWSFGLHWAIFRLCTRLHTWTVTSVEVNSS